MMNGMRNPRARKQMLDEKRAELRAKKEAAPNKGANAIAKAGGQKTYRDAFGTSKTVGFKNGGLVKNKKLR